MKKKITIILLSASLFVVGKKIVVDSYHININKDISSIVTTDEGKEIKIIRIQDENHRLTDDFAKTSRECPPYCIQPTKIHKDISTIGEVELFRFISNEVNSNKGILIDTRLRSWFEIESIPSSINIPYTSVENFSKENMRKLFTTLGQKKLVSGTLEFINAKNLVIFDNGPWCAQAQHFVDALLKYNYPTNKILYYRAGLQGWKLAGLTTVIHKAEIVE